jgi:enterochelin esterase-like enzyme
MRPVALLFLALLGCSTTSPPEPSTPAVSFDERSRCEDAPATIPACRADVGHIDEAVARAALGEQDLVFVRDDPQHLTIFARAALEEANLCCSLQGPMERIGSSDYWAARYRLARLDEAILTQIPPLWFNGRSFSLDGVLPRWRGPDAPPSPAVKSELEGERFERALWSEHLQETRRLFVYLPPGHDPQQSYPALFMADGANVMLTAGLVEHMIDNGLIPPLVLVGSASGQDGVVEDRSDLGISDLRAADYLPGYEGGGDRFENHLRFFSEELVAYAMREFGVTADPSRRAVTGFSNGGSFSVFAALRRPDAFGMSIPLSPSWRRLAEDDFAQSTRARFFMSAGLYEVPRWRAASGYAEALRARGYEVAFETPATGHDRIQEELMLARFLPLAFAPPL